MKKILYSIIALIFANLCYSQDFKQDFSKYLKENDTLKLKETLDKWDIAAPKDAELFVAYFNYYYLKSRQEVLYLGTETPRGEALVLQDSLGNEAGYLSSMTTYQDDFFRQGIDKIDKGIALYPNRLDMRFGKVYVFGQREMWQDFTDEIIKTVKHSQVNKNQWLWTNNEKLSDGKENLLSSIQSYQIQLFNTENDDLLKNMRKIGEEILKIYPQHIESMSNISISYMIEKEYDKALKYLLNAEKINPEDAIVLNNIAFCYSKTNENKKALDYYQKALKYSDYEENKAEIRARIEQLQNKQ